jgi:processing peptidase subunit alpha
MMRTSRVCRIADYKFGQPSLKKAFGVQMGKAQPQPDAGVKKTTLPNGVTVVSHDRASANTAIGFYVDAGAKYDPVTIPGLSYVMRFAIQSSNMDNSLFQLDRTMRSHGQSYGHGEVQKRHLFWKMEGRQDMWQKPLETLGTCISAPRFHEADIERFRDTMDNQLEEMRWLNPRQYCVDMLETVAFWKEPLGSPRHVWAASNDKANADALLNQWATYFLPSRVTVAGVNVEHNALVAAYNELPYPHSASAPHHARAAPALAPCGDESATFNAARQQVDIEGRAKEMGTRPIMEPEVIAAFGWSAAGRDMDIKKYAASAVAKEIVAIALNDGINYDRADTHHGVRSFYRPYSSGGLIGYTVRGSSEAAQKQVESTQEALAAMKVTDVQLASAIARATINLFNAEIERASDYVDFLATSNSTLEETEAAIKGVSADAVKDVIKNINSTVPSMYVTGDAYTFPSLKQFGWKA